MSKFMMAATTFACLPVLLGVAAYLFWVTLAICKPRFKATYLRNTVTTFTVIMFLCYPTIVNYTFQMVNCIDIDGKSVLLRDFDMECGSEEHTRALFTLCLPIVVIWVLGFPAFMFYLLYKRRRNLDDPENVIRYGLFYIGLTDDMFYWEIVVVNLRKIAFVSVAAGLEATILFRAMVCFGVLFINTKMTR